MCLDKVILVTQMQEFIKILIATLHLFLPFHAPYPPYLQVGHSGWIYLSIFRVKMSQEEVVENV
jgi:hypothetical protein